MAPEIVFGSRYGVEVDWWCVGVLLYELTVKRLPFLGSKLYTFICRTKNYPTLGETVTETHNAIMTEPPIFPSSVDKYLQKFISELLQKNSQKRLGPDFALIKHHIYFK